MAKAKLIRIIILIALLAVNQAYSPTVNKENDTTVSFSYCGQDEIRKLKESQQEKIQSECEVERFQELPENESPKEHAKPKPKDTQENNQATGNKVYIDGFGYVEPAEPPTAIMGTSDGDINKMVGEM